MGTETRTSEAETCDLRGARVQKRSVTSSAKSIDERGSMVERKTTRTWKYSSLVPRWVHRNGKATSQSTRK